MGSVRGNVRTVSIENGHYLTPGIITVSRNYPAILVGDGDNIPLLILDKEIALMVVGDGVTVIRRQQILPGTILPLFIPKVKKNGKPRLAGARRGRLLKTTLPAYPIA